MEAAVGNEPAFLLQGAAERVRAGIYIPFPSRPEKVAKMLSLRVVIKAEMFPFQKI